MSRPIKVSEELYDRLKERATEERSTLQNALIEVVTEPIVELEKVRSQLKEAQASLHKLERSDKQLRDEVEELGHDLREARSMVSSLRDEREEDLKGVESLIPTWQKLQGIADEWEKLGTRLQQLERLSHRHFGQDVQESE